MVSPNAKDFHSSQRLSQVQESAPDSSNHQHKLEVHGDEQFLQASDPAGSSPPSIRYVHTLERDLDAARRRIQECEATIIHQAHLIRQSPRLKTLHGIVCPDCNQEVPHTCTPLPRMSTTASAKQDENFRTIDAVNAPAAKSTPTINRYRPRGVLQRLWGSTNLRFRSSGTALSPAEVSTPNSGPNQLIAVSAPPTQYSEITKKQTDRVDGKLSHRNATSTSSQFPTIPLRSVSTNPASDLPISTSPKDALTSLQLNEPDWSIEYNLEVDMAVEVNLIRTIDVKTAYCVKFSPDGQLLAIAPTLEDPVSIYKASTGAKVCVLEDLYARESPSSTFDMSFSPNCKYLATSIDRPENIIKIWEVGKKFVRNALRGHQGYILTVVFSPNGRLLLSGSYDGTVRIWNMRDGSSRIFHNKKYQFCSICSSTDGRYVAAGTVSFGDILIWELRSGHVVALLKAHTTFVGAIAFMPNRERLVSSSWGGTLKEWDLATSIKQKNVGKQKAFRVIGHVTAPVRSISISPDGQYIVSGLEDKTVFIWNAASGEQNCILRGHQDKVVSVNFSPMGGYFATADLKGTVRIWSYKTCAQ